MKFILNVIKSTGSISQDSRLSLPLCYQLWNPRLLLELLDLILCISFPISPVSSKHFFRNFKVVLFSFSKLESSSSKSIFLSTHISTCFLPYRGIPCLQVLNTPPKMAKIVNRAISEHSKNSVPSSWVSVFPLVETFKGKI